MMEKIRSNIWKNLSEDQQKTYTRLAEKFHQSFDIDAQHAREHNVKEVALEECLAYLVESLRSGLHPKHTTIEERGLLIGGYGDDWFERFGYTRRELEGLDDLNGDRILQDS